MGISITQLLIILAIVVVLFGTKRLRNIGGDLGGAIKGFRKAVQDGKQASTTNEPIDGEVTAKPDNSKHYQAKSAEQKSAQKEDK